MSEYKILKHNDGRMLAVVWPEEPIQKDFYRDISNAKLWEEDDKKYFDAMNQYRKACEQAIANGIEFKDQEEIRLLIIALIRNENPLESLKPYEISSELKIEIDFFCIPSQTKGYCAKTTVCGCKQFAFIDRQPKEETDKEIKKLELTLWHGFAALCEERCKCHAECHKADDMLDDFKSRFRIERIK